MSFGKNQPLVNSLYMEREGAKREVIISRFICGGLLNRLM